MKAERMRKKKMKERGPEFLPDRIEFYEAKVFDYFQNFNKNQ